MLSPRRVSCAVMGALLSGPALAGTTIHVPGDQPSITAAIAAAGPQDTVLVAPGLYVESIHVPSHKHITVASRDGADVTILDGGGADVVIGLGLDGQTDMSLVVQGFTLRNAVAGVSSNGSCKLTLVGCTVRGCTGPAAVDLAGNAKHSLQGCVVTENAGLGVRVAQTSFDFFKIVTVQDSTLSHNGGGGLEGKWVELSGCVIEANGGVGAKLTAIGKVTGCTVIDNAGTGVISREVTDSLFAGNGGYGVESNAGTWFQANGCRFLGNGLGGVFAWSLDSHKPSNSWWSCLFSGGDGLRSKVQNTGGETADGVHDLRQCTFDGGPAITFEGGNEGLVISSIVRGTVITKSFAQPRLVRYSDIEGGAAGEGNIDADPLWASPATQDYALLPGSPCINTGDPVWSPGDADGSPPDMGAVTYDPWTELGAGVAGLAGTAQLGGTGSMVGGSTIGLELALAPATTPVTLVLGTSQLGAPFKGGTLWPAPSLLLPGLMTAGDGTLSFSGMWPAGLPAGSSFLAQAWWADAGAAFGVAGTQGLKGTQP
ncbi:MAG TPA: right-handed parallel beta-helix repeat-containing protein [Planctomycetota bacterium]|nr:right-handed parallel beta-helix repeat-containing protein [Planctomycetota bacterium]